MAGVRLLAVVGAAVTGLTSACGGTSAYDKLDPQDERTLERYEAPEFIIDLPGDPEVSEDTISSPAGDLDSTSYTIETTDATLVVTVVHLPPGAALDFRKAVDEVNRQPGGSVVSQKKIEYDGHRAYDVRYLVPAPGYETRTGFSRVIQLDGGVLVVDQLIEGKRLGDPPASYPKILASLEILD